MWWSRPTHPSPPRLAGGRVDCTLPPERDEAKLDALAWHILNKRPENRSSACGRALRPWLGRTPLLAAVLDPSGQASPAEQQPCRTGAASFTVARARGRARRR